MCAEEILDPVFSESCSFVIKSFTKLRQVGLQFQLWDVPLIGQPTLLATIPLLVGDDKRDVLPDDQELKLLGAEFAVKPAYRTLQPPSARGRVRTRVRCPDS